MKKIFLIEDDPSLGETLFDRLSQDYEVVWLQTCEAALQKIQSVKDFDLIVLDVGLPDGNGFDLAEQIRRYVKTPFLFLTAQADAESRLRGFQLGAEEFIPKPFHLKELLIRLNHVLKTSTKTDFLRLGSVEINFLDLQIINEKKETISLTSSEMRVLEILVKKAPQVVDRDEIMNQVWGVESQMSHRSIDNIIVKIRSSLSEAGHCVRTVRGRGYQWITTS